MRIQSDPKLNKKVYCCYSLDLRKYLSNLGIMYEVEGIKCIYDVDLQGDEKIAKTQ